MIYMFMILVIFLPFLYPAVLFDNPLDFQLITSTIYCHLHQTHWTDDTSMCHK